MERKISVRADRVRKSVPGNPKGDKMESSKTGAWEMVVDFSESAEGRITFTLADGSKRRPMSDQAVGIIRES